MPQVDPILQKVADIVSENMGPSTGEDFYKLYEFEDEQGILKGAKDLLAELVGPEMMDKKLAEVSRQA